jgi:hypothetical protein
MTLNAKKIPGNSLGNVEPVEPGGYEARVVQIIDLGEQKQRPYKGQEKPPCNEIMVTYEFCNEFLKDEDGKELEDKPRWYSERIPMKPFYSEKARSTKRYKAIDPNMVHDANWAKVVGMPCIVVMVHNTKDDKTYCNIGDVTPIREKVAKTLPELVNPPKVFDLEEPDLEVFYSLPEWVQDLIRGNLKYNGSTLHKALGGAAKVEEDTPVDDEDSEDEVLY